MLGALKHEANGWIFAFLLGMSILVANFLQCLSFLIFRPFSEEGFRNVSRLCAKYWWGFAVFLMEKIHKIQIHYTGDSFPPFENAMLLVNHQGLTDVLFLLCFAKKFNRLQDLKWFAKDILKFVPGIGWGLWFLDSIFLKREWMKDKESIQATFRKIREKQIPIWLVSFVEGTRLTPEKLKMSQEYAKTRGLKPFQNVLFPRTKGFVASVQGLGSHLQAVYDVTLSYKGKPPTVADVVFGRVHNPIHLHLRRFTLEDLPQQGEDQAEWLIQIYRDKDEYLGRAVNL